MIIKYIIKIIVLFLVAGVVYFFFLNLNKDIDAKQITDEFIFLNDQINVVCNYPSGIFSTYASLFNHNTAYHITTIQRNETCLFINDVKQKCLINNCSYMFNRTIIENLGYNQSDVLKYDCMIFKVDNVKLDVSCRELDHR